MEESGGELGGFLRARRSSASVESLPFPASGRRRVPGLRRDEVAILAGMSVDYYTRLEQGRETHPSAQVLDALAQAFDLTPHERRYLYGLAQLAWTPALTAPAPDAALLRLMDAFPGAACFVLDPLLDIVALNPVAVRLFAGFASTANLAEMVFLDPAGKSFYVAWERAAKSCVAHLRASSDVHADAPRRRELLRRLQKGSATFRDLWSAHEVAPKTFDVKELRHPEVGELAIAFHALDLPAMPGSQLIVYQAEPQSARAMRMLVEGAEATGVEGRVS